MNQNVLSICNNFKRYYMNFKNNFGISFFILLISGFNIFAQDVEKEPFKFKSGDSEFRLATRFKPEFFYGKNLRLLNNCNQFDQVAYLRHTVDFLGEYHYGHVSRGYDVMLAKFNIRNKAVWGDPESIFRTTGQTIKDLEVVYGAHQHAVARMIPWIREMWVMMSITDVLDWMPFVNRHYLTIGAFPFELGRGIALGSAYAIGPEAYLGYRSENTIDQYAFGLKLSGDIVKKELSYDLYCAILDDKSSTWAYTSEKIRGNQYNHRYNQFRGFGIVNYVVAGRLRWKPFCNTPDKYFMLEPYCMFADNREQRIVFPGDASARLGTLGASGELKIGRWSTGFDTAYNIGRQKVAGVDRNTIVHENRDGFIAIVNSHVLQNGRKALYVPANQDVINSAIQCSDQNGQLIGSNTLDLRNSNDRFRNPYTNLLRGSMFVWDISYLAMDPCLTLSGSIGFASGDENPNADLVRPGEAEEDRIYKGFIGLMESYAGDKVKSAYLLGGAGKIPRILSFPSEEVQTSDVFSVTRFTNLVYGGLGADYKPILWKRKWKLNPNFLAYWQDNPTRGSFRVRDLDSNIVDNTAQDIQRARRDISKFLGVELNLFSSVELLPDLSFWLITAGFLPGQHYTDIKGRPLNRAQQRFIDRKDRTGILDDPVPLLGDDNSWYINFGLTYIF